MEMVVEAPLVSRKCKAGQFIIFRLDEFGERVPLTIADYDRENGTVTIPSLVYEGQTITVTAAPADNYKLSGLLVMCSMEKGLAYCVLQVQERYT